LTSEHTSDLHNSIIASGQSSWFGVRLIFCTGVDKTGKRLSVDDDRWLLEAGSAEEAYAEAAAGAQAAERMGSALAEGRPSALEAAGLDRFVEVFFPEECAPEKQPQWRRRVPGNMRGNYTTYEFLGFADLHVVGRHLKHGIEIDRYVIELDAAAPPLKIPAKRALMAFDPSGPAYTGKARRLRNSELFERHKWYLAERVFQLSDGQGRKSRILGRLVLIEANGPQDAYNSALLESEASQALECGTFVGLKQLSLITDNFRKVCILRTDQYSLRPTQLRELIRAKPDLSVFQE